jgi:hypothetical protein
MLAREKYHTEKKFSSPNNYVQTESSLFSKSFKDIFAQNSPKGPNSKGRRSVLSKDGSQKQIKFKVSTQRSP